MRTGNRMSLFEDKELFTELLKDGQEGDHIGNVKAMVTELVQSADIYFNRSKYDYYARLNVSDETKSARELLAISLSWLSSKSISKDALDALGDAAVSA